MDRARLLVSGAAIAEPTPPSRTAIEPWIERANLGVHLGRDDWWIELRVREGMPSRPYARPRQFKLSQVDAWLKGRDLGDQRE